MLSRRALLASAAVAVCAGSSQGIFAQSGGVRRHAGLGALALRRGVLYGTATNTTQLLDTDFVGALEREAKILVPEYEMKRALVQPEADRFDFAAVDSLAGFAQSHGMAFRGHPLVWHKRNPDWLETALASSSKESLLTQYVETVVTRYRGRVHSWDVVNEALAPEGDNVMRVTSWLKAFGPNYIDLAFHAARAADPKALLVYNDWGCEAAANDAFRAHTLDFLEGALKRGVPIDAYGMQGHLQAFGPKIDQKKLAAFVASLKSLGLRLLVTEHDVDDRGGSLDVSVRDAAVADMSRNFLDVVFDSSATVAVLTWGLSDRFLYPTGLRDRWEGYSPRMLPLDRNLNEVPMWEAMAGALAGTQARA